MHAIDPAATAWLLASTALVLLMTPGLAIFYGAAHMQDMESRLKELGFEKAGQTWVTAWDIPAAKPVTTRPVLPKNEPATKKSTGVRGTIRT